MAQILDADVKGPAPYVVTRYVPGGRLTRRSASRVRCGAPPSALAMGLAEALAAIHAAGVIHRDLKPANVMLEDGQPVVIDFGIAHVPDATRLTRTGLVMGTPGYVAPEVIEGQPSSSATDMHSWGTTVAFAATGRQPFGTGDFQTVFFRGCGATRRWPACRRAPAARPAALATSPAARPQARQLADQCAGLGPGGQDGNGRHPVGQDARGRDPRGRTRADGTRADGTRIDRTRSYGDGSSVASPPRPPAPSGWQNPQDQPYRPQDQPYRPQDQPYRPQDQPAPVARPGRRGHGRPAPRRRLRQAEARDGRRPHEPNGPETARAEQTGRTGPTAWTGRRRPAGGSAGERHGVVALAAVIARSPSASCFRSRAPCLRSRSSRAARDRHGPGRPYPAAQPPPRGAQRHPRGDRRPPPGRLSVPCSRPPCSCRWRCSWRCPRRSRRSYSPARPRCPWRSAGRPARRWPGTASAPARRRRDGSSGGCPPR